MQFLLYFINTSFHILLSKNFGHAFNSIFAFSVFFLINFLHVSFFFFAYLLSSRAVEITAEQFHKKYY